MRVVLNAKVVFIIPFNSTEHVHAEKAIKQMRTDTLACMQKRHPDHMLHNLSNQFLKGNGTLDGRHMPY
jgi:hypothetical protein